MPVRNLTGIWNIYVMFIFQSKEIQARKSKYIFDCTVTVPTETQQQNILAILHLN